MRAYTLTSWLTIAVLLAGGLLPAGAAPMPAPPAPQAAALSRTALAPSAWCVAGSFQGWNNASHPLYDDGTHGDLIPGDGVLSAEYAIAEAARYEWKTVTCGDWGQTHPAANSWFYTTLPNQVVLFTLDTNTYADGWQPSAYIVNANDDIGASFTAVGDFNSWNNGDPTGLMTAVGSGRYLVAYTIAAAGSYIGKVTRTGTWDAYGADGRSTDAGNISFTTTSDNQVVYIQLDTATGRVRIDTPGAPPASPWYARGGFNGWGTSDPLYDDGTHGDLVPADGVFSADIAIASAGRYEWKVANNDWSQSWPTTGNSWLVTTQADQVVHITFDTNAYSDGWSPTTNILNVNDNVADWTAVGDWQGWNNANPATAMAFVGNDKYLLAFDIAAPGEHWYKAVRTGTWDAIGADNRSVNADSLSFTTTGADQTAYFLLDLVSGRIRVYLAPPVTPPGHDNNVWWDGLEHNSRDSFYRQPFGAVTTGTPITLRFRTFAGDVTGVKVRVWDTKLGGQILYNMNYLTTIPGDPFDYDIWQLQLTAPNYLTVLYYRFLVTDGSDTDYYEDDDLFDGGLGKVYSSSPDNSWQIDVYDPNFDTPDWFKDAVVYQIFPDRFRNGVGGNDPISGTFFYNETPGVLSAPQWNWIVPDPRVVGSPWEGSYSKLFYGGDLQGVIDELDYLQSLGVTTLYFNPIFESPSNHKYDTTNYEEIDDNFGDLATFQALAAALDARGMHMILDGVFNHTSSDSHYFDRYGRYPGFVGACEDVNSPYRSWYYFTPASPPGTGVCAGDTNYNAWWGFDSLPKLNTTDNQAVRDYIYNDTPAIAQYWLTQGADGWRLDVAGDVAHSFWKDWRDDIRAANPNAITIAEEWGDASQFILGDELDSTMNYRFRNAIIGLLRETNWQDTNSTIRALSVSQFDSVMHGIQEDYPPEAFYALMNLVGSHDVNRVLIPLDQDGDPTDADYSDGKARLRVLVIIQMTMPGAPTVYYGDEVGLVGYGDANGGGVFYSDPYNRQPYPWPDEPGYNDLPAWRQQDVSLRQHYSAAIAIRHAHPALRTGSFDTLLTDDDNDLYAYGRRLGDDIAVVAINRSVDTTQTITVDVSGYLPDGTALTDELNGGAYTVAGGQIVLNNVPAMWGAILTVDSGQDLTPPDAPVLSAAEGDGAVYLSWTVPVSPVLEYNVYRSYVSGGGYAFVTTTASTAFTDTDVANGAWYYYVVNALGANGVLSEYSNEQAALPHAPIGWAGGLLPVSIVHTIGLTPTEIITAQVWVDGVTNSPGQGAGVVAELGYGVSGTLPASWTMWTPMGYYGDVGNNDIYSATLTPEMTGTYQYLARFSTTGGREWTYAYTFGGQPGALTVQASADTTPPAAPADLEVTDWGANYVSLAWTPIAGDPTLYAYDVYRSLVSGTVGVKIGRVLAPGHEYTDAGVNTGQTYYYVVQALDTSFNRSGYSNQVEATPQPKLVAVTFQAVAPGYTPADATVYVVGDRPELCGWCNPQTIALQKTGDVTWTRVITLPDGVAIQYKYTRGNWDINEWWGPIVGTNNRHATVEYGSNGAQLLADVVPYWRDPLVISHQPLAGAVDVDPAGIITATLSRYLDPVTLTPDNIVLSGGAVTPTLNIGYYYHTEMTATTIILTPTAALDEGALYTVRLKTGLKGRQDDNEGIPLQQEYAWSFTTQAATFDVAVEQAVTSVYAIAVRPVVITNNDIVTHTFDLTRTGNTWPAALSAAQATVGAGLSATVMLTVEIPAGAPAYAIDAMTLSVTPDAGGSIDVGLTTSSGCRFDFAASGLVDISDVVVLLGYVGTVNPYFNVNHSGGVDVTDAILMLGRFGQSCQ